MLPLLYYTTLCCVDRIFRALHFRRVDYLFHALHHLLLSLLTVTTLRIPAIHLDALYLILAFELYHVTMYHLIFQFNDWIHLIERLFIATPLSLYTHSPCLAGYTLFALAAPFGFDYLTLFLYRNGGCVIQDVHHTHEWLNQWICRPIAVLHAVTTAVFLYSRPEPFGVFFLTGVAGIILVAGQSTYFAQELRENTALESQFTSLLHQQVHHKQYKDTTGDKHE